MKRNAIIRIILWSIVLAVLLAMMFVLLYVPGAGRRLRREESPVETMVPAPLPRVTSPADIASGNAITTSDINVRMSPDTMSAVVAFAEKGTVLNILRQETIGSIQWGYIGAPTQGWVAMAYVELLESVVEDAPATETTASQEQTLQSNVVSTAAAHIQEIEIEWAAGSITIQPKDIDEIRIVEDGLAPDMDPMVWAVRDSELSIQYSKNTDHDFGMGLLQNVPSKNLIIQVPFDWICNSLEINAASASLEINDLTIREMEFDGASGTCVFNNCTVEILDLDTASGDILFQGKLTQMDCDAASANIILDLTNVPTSLNMDTASGNLNLVLPEGAGFTVSMDTLSGEFESDFDTTLRNGSYVAGNGSCRIDVDAMSGDVIIRKGA